MRHAVLLAAQALVGALAERNYRSLPAIQSASGADRGRVAIVIPARNEAHRLPPLLASLVHLTYGDYEVVVVDDGSDDGTGRIAEASGVRVIRIEGPPPGWLGKSFACQTGADATSSEWLLFTDADTIHGPESLSSALALAQTSAAGVLSLLPRHRCCSFWERLLLPYAHALYFAGAWRVNRAGGSAVANGQYMLFRRAAYEQLGGHTAVAGQVTEDVALARVARERGIGVCLARAEDLLEVRMYEGLVSLWEGFAKNALQFVTAEPWAGAITVGGAIAISAAVPAALRSRSRARRVTLVLLPALALLPWYRRFGATNYALLTPLAAATFQLIALDSMRRSVRPGGTVWKGRRY